MRRVLFIDRDGTLIEEPPDERVDALEKLRFMPGVFTALAALSQAGYTLLMVTNQDGLGSAEFPQAAFDPRSAFCWMPSTPRESFSRACSSARTGQPTAAPAESQRQACWRATLSGIPSTARAVQSSATARAISSSPPISVYAALRCAAMARRRRPGRQSRGACLRAERAGCLVRHQRLGVALCLCGLTVAPAGAQGFGEQLPGRGLRSRVARGQ
jgi:hypothetical protein